MILESNMLENNMNIWWQYYVVTVTRQLTGKNNSTVESRSTRITAKDAPIFQCQIVLLKSLQNTITIHVEINILIYLS